MPNSIRSTVSCPPTRRTRFVGVVATIGGGAHACANWALESSGVCARAIDAADIANHNLVLFGDPASNSVIARVLPKLPLRWTRQEIAIGAERYAASDHVAVLVYPNPLNPKRYVVLNSGHTFGAEDFRGTNAWLYPRIGDYAVLNADGSVAASGFFDEQWRLK